MKIKTAVAFMFLFAMILASIQCGASYDDARGSDTSLVENYWDGVYATNAKDNGTEDNWSPTYELSLSWGKYVRYNESSIKGVRFLDNSSFSWTDDEIFGSGQIWFSNEDNRSYYWPDGKVSGKVFTGWMQPIFGDRVDLRGLNLTASSSGGQSQIKCVGPSCSAQDKSCESCSNGKVCNNGMCVCPSGTVDCFGRCIDRLPCGGDCPADKVCIDGRCVCPNGTKECNNRCISINECCGGCPPWKVCYNGICGCPQGIADCSDPLPL